MSSIYPYHPDEQAQPVIDYRLNKPCQRLRLCFTPYACKVGRKATKATTNTKQNEDVLAEGDEKAMTGAPGVCNIKLKDLSHVLGRRTILGSAKQIFSDPTGLLDAAAESRDPARTAPIAPYLTRVLPSAFARSHPVELESQVPSMGASNAYTLLGNVG